LVLLLPVINFEDKLMEDYLLKAGSTFCFQDDALYFMQNYIKPDFSVELILLTPPAIPQVSAIDPVAVFSWKPSRDNCQPSCL
jgi:hypothetical protein